jgi:hypothetical protein
MRAQLERLRARHDSGAVAPGVYSIIKLIETEVAWSEHRQDEREAAR